MDFLLIILVVSSFLSTYFFSISKSYEFMERVIYDLIIKYSKQGEIIFLQGKSAEKVKQILTRSMIMGLIPFANLVLPFIYKIHISFLIEKAKDEAITYKLNTEQIEKMKKCQKCDELVKMLSLILGNDNIPFTISFLNEKPNNVIDLTYDNQLVPMAYTLDEVKMISEYLDVDFDIYKIDGINTAIISDDITEETIILVNGESKPINLVDFTNPDNRFKIYLGKTNVELMKLAEECVQKISEKRRTKNKNDIMSNNINIIQNKEKKTNESFKITYFKCTLFFCQLTKNGRKILAMWGYLVYIICRQWQKVEESGECLCF